MATIYCGTKTFQAVEAVLFDKDGTLADCHDFLHALVLARSSFVEAQVPGVKESLLKTFGLVNGRINPVGLIAVSTRQEDEIATAACIAATGRDWIEAKTIAHTALLDADRALPPKAKLTPLFNGALPLLQSRQGRISKSAFSRLTPKKMCVILSNFMILRLTFSCKWEAVTDSANPIDDCCI